MEEAAFTLVFIVNTDLLYNEVSDAWKSVVERK